MVRMSFHHAAPQKNKLERLLMRILTMMMMMMILIIKWIQYWWWHSRYAASDKVHRHCTAGHRSDFFATTLLKLSCSSCIRFPRGERRTETEKLTFPYHHHHRRLPSQLPTSRLPSWGAILRWAILSTSIIRIAHPNYYVFFQLIWP